MMARRVTILLALVVLLAPGGFVTTPQAAARERAPSGDRSDGKGCLRSGCHTEISAMPVRHGPVLAAACDKCHEPVGTEAEHRFQLVHDRQEICTSCHRIERVLAVPHQPFAEAKCLDCHDPHGGHDRSFLAAESIGELCEKCHEPRAEEHLHGPVAVGQCNLCHRPHQSDHEHLTVHPQPELCVQCHEQMANRLGVAPYVHGPAAVDCAACHNPHGGKDRLMLRKEGKSLCLDCHDAVEEKLAQDTHVHGALEEEKGCAGCHDPHASQYKSQLRALASELCLGCHNRQMVNRTTRRKVANIAREVVSAKFKHGPIRTGDCQGCHFPHSGTHANLLRETYPPEFYQDFDETHYRLCFGCHEKSLVLAERTVVLTRFRDGDRNLHYLHVNRENGRTCRACHEVHASDRHSHLRESVPFGKIRWALPINYQKTETGGACSPGCHRPASYDNGGKLASEGKRTGRG